MCREYGTMLYRDYGRNHMFPYSLRRIGKFEGSQSLVTRRASGINNIGVLREYRTKSLNPEVF